MTKPASAFSLLTAARQFRVAARASVLPTLSAFYRQRAREVLILARATRGPVLP